MPHYTVVHFIFHPFHQVLIFTFGSPGTAVIVLAAVLCDYRSGRPVKHWSRDPQGWPVLCRRHPDRCWESHCYGNWEMTASKVCQYRINLTQALTNLWFRYSIRPALLPAKQENIQMFTFQAFDYISSEYLKYYLYRVALTFMVMSLLIAGGSRTAL